MLDHEDLCVLHPVAKRSNFADLDVYFVPRLEPLRRRLTTARSCFLIVSYVNIKYMGHNELTSRSSGHDHRAGL